MFFWENARSKSEASLCFDSDIDTYLYDNCKVVLKKEPFILFLFFYGSFFVKFVCGCQQRQKIIIISTQI